MRYLILLMGFTALSFAFEVYVAPRYMVWEEYDAGGDRLLREEGWLIALGVAGEGRLLRGSAEVYGGRLAYDGQTQGGTPVQTDTVYSGFRLQGGVGWDLGEEIVFSPRLLYTLEGWVRDIRSTSYALGYREYWSYNTLDLAGMISHARGNMRGYMFGTLRLMLGDAVMRTDLAGVPTIYPRRGPAFDLGCGVRIGRLRLEISHSYVKFNRSDPVPTASPGVFALQPESVRRTLSFTLALRF